MNFTSTPDAAGLLRAPASSAATLRAHAGWPAAFPGRWKWIIGAWGAVALFAGTRHYLQGLAYGRDPGWWRTLGMWVTCYAIWAALTPGLLWLAERFPLRLSSWRRAVAVHVPASIAAALVYLGLTALVFPQVWWDRAASSVELFKQSFLASFHTEVLTYWGVLGLVEGVRYYAGHREREREAARIRLRMAQLETGLTAARLDALRMQLNPHFLFNTLNTVCVLMREDVDAADRMLGRLGALLRASLESGQDHLVPLRREMVLLDQYFDIERIRFGDRLRLQVEIDPETRDLPVPPFVLQPIVENAIRYAISPRTTPGWLRVAAWRSGGSLVLSVTDDGPGFRGTPAAAKGTGIGLSNTRARLDQLYPGGAARLEFHEPPAGGLEVRIVLPAAPAEQSPTAARPPA